MASTTQSKLHQVVTGLAPVLARWEERSGNVIRSRLVLELAREVFQVQFVLDVDEILPVMVLLRRLYHRRERHCAEPEHEAVRFVRSETLRTKLTCALYVSQSLQHDGPLSRRKWMSTARNNDFHLLYDTVLSFNDAIAWETELAPSELQAMHQRLSQAADRYERHRRPVAHTGPVRDEDVDDMPAAGRASHHRHRSRSSSSGSRKHRRLSDGGAGSREGSVASAVSARSATNKPVPTRPQDASVRARLQAVFASGESA